jgi:hypothetical protein
MASGKWMCSCLEERLIQDLIHLISCPCLRIKNLYGIYCEKYVNYENIYVHIVTDFRFSCWLIIEVDSVLGLFHDVVVGDVADILEVHAIILSPVSILYLLLGNDCEISKNTTAVTE